MKKITINSITCVARTNISNGNDVFLMVQSDGGPPIRYAVEGTWTMNDGTSIGFPTGGDPDKPQFVYEQICYISVWDHDGMFGWVNAADMLGNAFFETNSPGGLIEVWGVDGSFYNLDVSIENYSPPSSQPSTPVPTSLQQSIQQELEAWAATDDGKSVLGETDKSTLEDKFSHALKTAFQNTMHLISDLPWIESVSLGITAQVEIFGGIQGDFGVVMGLENALDEYTIYGGGAIVEGFEAGVSAAINFGVWSQQPKDVGGFYEGVEVEVTDVIGLSGTVWVGRGDRDKVLGEDGSILNTLKLAKAVFLGFDLGLDDGVSAEELYIIAGHIEDYPSFQTGTYKNMAVLTKLECVDKHSSGDSAHDSVSLHWTVDNDAQAYKYPLWNAFEMNESGKDDDHDDSIWECGTVIKFDDSFRVTLFIESSSTKEIDHHWEIDDFDGVGDTHKITFEDGGTEYKLTAKLLVKG
ncbi:MAG: hypothetical protein P1U56_19680 [Saprospiraceae bacterium]|nr:hypothetical protein [Saprospiraceae bacterium]